jgi:hypothetical protein
MYGDVSFDSFHDELAQYGYWGYSDRWGLVWQPANVPDDFRPYYTAGRWVYTDDYGWYWASDLPWGDVAFHYGRWVDDPYDGWMWIPGYTWSPGWVVWRSNGQYIGWMPTPPDDAFLQGRGDVSFGLSFGAGGVSFNWNNDPTYGYRRWYGQDFDERRFADNWVFVGTGNLADHDYRRVIVRDPRLVINIIHQTRSVTHYTVVNNYVVNKSIDVRVVQRAAGHPIQITASRDVIRNPNLVMRVDAGRRIQERERLIAPHGTGLANSAPPPPPSVVGKLSTQVPPPRNGGPSQHLFTRTTIANPDVQSRFHGKPVGGPAPGGMTGPGGTTGPRAGASDDQLHQREYNQSNGQAGRMNGPGAGGGMTGPNGSGGATGPGGPGGMMGPSGGPNSGQTPWGTHRPVQNPPGGQPGGSGTPNPDRSMGGPGGSSGMTGPGGTDNQGQTPPMVRHRDRTPQGDQPGMNGPNPAGSMGGPSGQGGMNGPGGSDNQGQTPPVVRHRDQTPQSGQPGGMNGPGNGGGMGGPAGVGAGATGPTEHRTRPETQPPSPPPPPATGQDQPPKPEKKKPHPDTPPGQPQ